MGLGSENAEQRKRFTKVVKADWKARVKGPEDARRIITMLRESTLLQMDSYAQRKIRALETYISISNKGESLKEFETRMK